MAGSKGNAVLTCQAVATVLSKRDVHEHPPRRRTKILHHLARCEHCITFTGELDCLRKAAAAMLEAFDAEVPDLHAKIVRRMRKVS